MWTLFHIVLRIAIPFSMAVLHSFSAAQESKRIAIYLPFSQESFRGLAHSEAIDQLVNEYGSQASFDIKWETLSDSIGAEIDQLSQEGYAGIILVSPRYYNPAVKQLISMKERPYVAVLADNSAPRLVSTFGMKMHDAFYLAGLLAGNVSRSKKAGFVSTVPTSSTVRNINAFTIGFRKSSPTGEVLVYFTGSSSDPEEERFISDWMVNKSKADVLMHDTGSGAVPIYAVENRVWTVPFRLPETVYRAIRSSTMMRIRPNWAGLYRQQVARALSGTQEPDFFWHGMKENAIVAEDFNALIPVPFISEVEDAVKAIRSGNRSAFHGPFRSADGKINVAQGEKISDERLVRMNFFVQGVKRLKGG